MKVQIDVDAPPLKFRKEEVHPVQLLFIEILVVVRRVPEQPKTAAPNVDEVHIVSAEEIHTEALQLSSHLDGIFLRREQRVRHVQSKEPDSARLVVEVPVLDEDESVFVDTLPGERIRVEGAHPEWAFVRGKLVVVVAVEVRSAFTRRARDSKTYEHAQGSAVSGDGVSFGVLRVHVFSSSAWPSPRATSTGRLGPPIEDPPCWTKCELPLGCISTLPLVAQLCQKVNDL